MASQLEGATDGDALSPPMAKTIKPTPVTITLQLGDQTYTSSGATVVDALTALPKPDKIMTKGVLTVSQGKASRKQLFMPVRLKRLFYNKYFQAIQAKNLALGLKL